jgi:hypothetical protein
VENNIFRRYFLLCQFQKIFSDETMIHVKLHRHRHRSAMVKKPSAFGGFSIYTERQ